MKNFFLGSIVAIFILTGCGEDKQETKTQVIEKQEVKTLEEKEKTPETKFVEQVKDSAAQVAQKIVEESKKVAKTGSDAASSVSKKVVDKTEEITKKVSEVANETQSKIEKSMEEIVATKSENSLDKGKSLFLKCAGCHGQQGEIAALGKSQIIKGWSKEQVSNALKGYKNSTYGQAMKGVMKSQVMNLSDEEIDALASYISSF